MGGTQAAPAECEDDDTDRDAEPAEEEFEFVGGTQASPPDEDETEPAGAVPEDSPAAAPQADSPAAAPRGLARGGASSGLARGGASSPPRASRAEPWVGAAPRVPARRGETRRDARASSSPLHAPHRTHRGGTDAARGDAEGRREGDAREGDARVALDGGGRVGGI